MTANPLPPAAGDASRVPGARPRIVVIDDDEVLLLSCRRILEKAGYSVETFEHSQEGLTRIAAAPPQLLLVDLKMPEMDGFEVIARVRQIDPAIVIAVLTGYATVDNAVEAMQAGAYDFLPKPFTPDELRLLVRRGSERWTLADESARLRREKEEAERRFITFVTHQLKSPVVAVKQYLDVLLFGQRDALPPQAAEWLQRSQARLAEMLAVIEDWLTLARIERGVLSAPAGRGDLGAAAARVVDMARADADAAGVAIRVACDEGVVVVGDAISLSTVISNLVNNAVKYNHAGGSVEVRVAREDHAGRLEVSDTGVGIAEDCLPSLFREFSRIRDEATQAIAGTGLGLAICKRIVGELGGTIDVASRKGEGSRFTVRLPLAREGDAAGAAAAARQG